jgi:hypothetical protein
MGIDYHGVGGIGMEVTEEMIEDAYYNPNYPSYGEEEMHEDMLNELLGESPLEYATAGNTYSGKTVFYLMVPGTTFGEIQENIPVFLESIFQVFDIKKDPADLEVISDLLVY